MVAFVVMSYLAIPYCALAIRFLRSETSISVMWVLGVAGAIGLYCHPFFPIPIAVMLLTYLIIFWRDLPKERITTLLTVVPLVSLLPNLAWLYPILHLNQVHVDNSLVRLKGFDAGRENVIEI